MEEFVKITVSTTINATVEKVWECFNEPNHVVNWNFAAPEWHCPKSSNDLRVGGKFNHTMAAKDGSFSFDFEGKYLEIKHLELIHYDLVDGRNIYVTFEKEGNATKVTEVFDAETENTIELQKGGWQAILNNLKGYIESLN